VVGGMRIADGRRLGFGTLLIRENGVETFCHHPLAGAHSTGRPLGLAGRRLPRWLMSRASDARLNVQTRRAMANRNKVYLFWKTVHTLIVCVDASMPKRAT
jgi:hypothetical protein